MKLCYVYDGMIVEEKAKIFGNVIEYRQFNRFARHFDSILVVARRGSYSSEHVELDVPKIDVRLVDSINTPMSYVNHYKTVNETIKESMNSCDIVYVTVGPMGYLAHKYAIRSQKKYIVFQGGCVFDSLRSIGNIYKRSLSRYAFKQAKRIMSNANYAIYVSEYLQKKYPTNGRWCVWSGVDLPKVTPEQIEDRRNRIRNNTGMIKVGLIGYVHNYVKGIDTAIKALARVERKSLVLRILGRGDHRYLDKIVSKLHMSDKIEFCGAIRGGKAVIDWLDDIDIYIQPSRTEGLPKATLEAMSRGCPVISSNVGGLPDLVMREWMHKPGDYRTLGELIQKLSSSKHTMLSLSEHSYSVASRYSKVKLDEIFDNFFGQIIRDLG